MRDDEKIEILFKGQMLIWKFIGITFIAVTLELAMIAFCLVRK